MALDTYSDLSTAITDWLDDSSLSTSVDTFIRLAEARFNRVIRHVDMEAFTTLSATGESVALPTDALGIRTMWIDGSPDDQLEELSLPALKQLYGGAAGTPLAYAVAGGNIFLGPVPSSATLQTAYYSKIANLSSSDTPNWLFTSHPDIYLLASLVAAELRGWNDSRLPLLKSALDEALGELERAGQNKRYGGAPLQARAAVSA